MSAPDDALRVTVTGTGDIPRVTITGEVDLASATVLRAAVEPVLRTAVERIELDLAGVSFLDSSGLAVFIELAADHTLLIVAASNAVERIITVTGLDETLGLER